MRTKLAQNLRSLASDLTKERVRGHAALLGLILWGAYAINIATPGLSDREGQLKGADFLHFYVLGNIARMHDGSMLYDAGRQTELAKNLIHQVPNDTYLPVYGPQVSLLFSPFAGMSYGWATAAWMLVSALIFGVCCWLVLRTCPRLRNYKSIVFVLALAFPGFFFLVSSGQNSAVALIAFTAAFFSFRAQQPFLAGLAIGLLMYKPQFGIMAAILFLFTFEWRVVAGALITGAGQLMAATWYYGQPVLEAYFRTLKHADQNASAPLFRMHGLRTFWQMLLPWHGIGSLLYVATALAVIVITIRSWRSKAALEDRYAIFLLGSALIDPHLTDYDLVMLMPALLLIGDRILLSSESTERDAARVLTYAAYFLPLFGTTLKFLHLQLSVPAYVGLFLVLAAFIRKEGNIESRREQASPVVA